MSSGPTIHPRGSRASRFVLALGALLATGALGAQARAQAGDGFSVELFEPAPVQGRSILGVGTSDALGHGEWSVGAFFHYQDDPLTLIDESDRDTVLARFVEDRIVAELHAGFGLFEVFELGVAMPFALSQSGDDLAPLGRPGEAVAGFSLGDLRLVPKIQIMGGPRGFGLHLGAVVALPTGDQDQFGSDGAVRVRPLLGLGYAEDGLRVAVELGYELRSALTAGSYVSDDMLRWGLGMRIPLVRGVGLLLAGQGTLQTADAIDPNDPDQALSDAPAGSVEGQAAIELTVAGGLVITAGAGASFVRAVGSPDARGFLGLAWTPAAAPDGDFDGVPDSEDQCPDKPEDEDRYLDTDGCPEPDNDRDGILDVVDRCPVDAEDKDGFQDGDGCPDADPVHDVIVGTVRDDCPGEPEDEDGFEDEDGCPDPDNDGDGVLDAADKCPLELEDKDGYLDEDGCKDPDNDSDGVEDWADKCPSLPEVLNNVNDTDGCPDHTERDILVTPTELRITKKVNFGRDSDKIKAESFAILDAMARVLGGFKHLTLVRVEGHTDSEGPEDFNQQLSQRRAEAIVAYLVTKGVEPKRLVAQGFGESKPAMPNDTPMGRAKNRRVEFHIVEVNGKPLAPAEKPAPEAPKPGQP